MPPHRRTCGRFFIDKELTLHETAPGAARRLLPWDRDSHRRTLTWIVDAAPDLREHCARRPWKTARGRVC